MGIPIVVTGGAGFIGGHIVNALCQRGSKVIIIDKGARPRSLPRSSNLTYYKADAYYANALNTRSLRMAPIIHLAAETSVEESVRRPLSTVRANIGLTCSMLETARKLDSGSFVLASTAAVYGERNGACGEKDTPAPASAYAVSKLASEYYCKMYSELYGIPTVILRYFNVYGPRQSSNYAGVISHFVKRVLQERPPIIFGDGNQTRDFVFVADVVRATIASIMKPLPGGTVINIGTGKPISINALARKVLEIFKTTQLRPYHTAAREGEVRHSRADISVAWKKIGFQPRYDLDKGLRITVDWLREAS